MSALLSLTALLLLSGSVLWSWIVPSPTEDSAFVQSVLFEWYFVPHPGLREAEADDDNELRYSALVEH